jgi:hypothetical protein
MTCTAVKDFPVIPNSLNSEGNAYWNRPPAVRNRRRRGSVLMVILHGWLSGNVSLHCNNPFPAIDENKFLRERN